ncbi:hypothetical protein [Chitinophaga cymbidii]|uniref:hypothetical protein n=1 Tax=Chitinophaga cymbidii TaxID=1096750 RepID=UPI0011BD8EBB|nr:hypothetical protein [Chitinophaga cymbidii]
MKFTIMSTGIYHQICREISRDTHFSVPYICYRLYEILRKESILYAVEFFVESELARLLTNTKEKFTLAQDENGEIILVQEANGISPAPEATGWDEFFRLHHIECSPELQQEIDQLLLSSLERNNTAFSDN